MRLRFVAVLALFTVACAEPGDLQQEASVASGLLGSKCETIATSEMASAAVGRVDGEQSVAFGRVADAALIGDGRFIVLDGLERSMSIFDSTGHRTGQIGRRGSGPGEFEAPMGVHVSGDSIVVWDRQLRRWSFFDLNGSLLNTQGFSPPRMGGVIGPFRNGSIVVHRGTPFQLGEVIRDTLIVEHYTSLEDSATLIGRFAGSMRFADSSQGFSVFRVPFAPQASVAGWRERNAIAVGASDSASVQLISLDDGDSRRVPVPLEGAVVTGDMVRVWREENATAAALMAEIDIRDRAPPFRSVHADAAGFLWVKAEPLPGQGSSRFVVLDDEGELVEDLQVSGEADFLAADENYVLLRKIDSLDVQSVELYRRRCTRSP